MSFLPLLGSAAPELEAQDIRLLGQEGDAAYPLSWQAKVFVFSLMAKIGFSVPKNIGYSGVPCSCGWEGAYSEEELGAHQPPGKESLLSSWNQGGCQD